MFTKSSLKHIAASFAIAFTAFAAGACLEFDTNALQIHQRYLSYARTERVAHAATKSDAGAKAVDRFTDQFKHGKRHAVKQPSLQQWQARVELDSEVPQLNQEFDGKDIKKITYHVGDNHLHIDLTKHAKRGKARLYYGQAAAVTKGVHRAEQAEAQIRGMNPGLHDLLTVYK